MIITFDGSIAIELSSGCSQGLVRNPLRTHDMSSSSVLMMTGIRENPTYPPPQDSMFLRFQGTFLRFHGTIFRGVQRFFLLAGELSRLGLGLGRLFSMQVSGVLEQYRHFASSTSSWRLVRINPEIAVAATHHPPEIDASKCGS